MVVPIETLEELLEPVAEAAPPERRLLIVSNRLPIALGEDRRWSAQTAWGGLSQALVSLLERHGGTWIGWGGATEEEAPELSRVVAGSIQQGGYSLRPVPLTADERRGYYDGFSNQVLWPLLHDSPGHCTFDPRYWRAYRKVNRKFARAILRLRAGHGLVWAHDYHLMSLAAELRRLDPSPGTSAAAWTPAAPGNRLAFFLHTPFPSPDVFLRLPWRERLLADLLAYDQLGFQTRRDLASFLACVEILLPGARVSEQRVVRGARATAVGSFPVGADFRRFAALAASPGVERRAAELRRSFGDRKLLLGVDRLDPAKGIPEKLAAFAELLSRHRDLADRVCLLQVVMPSREDLPAYRALKGEIERQVGEINGRFGKLGWVPVHFAYRSLDHAELAAHYRAADVALVTPLKDGMNLVAKEYCAANLGEDGVLVLSEFAGAATQLDVGSLVVNPHDIKGTARTLRRALRLPRPERQLRMGILRGIVRREDVFHWVDSFLARAQKTERGSGRRADVRG